MGGDLFSLFIIRLYIIPCVGVIDQRLTYLISVLCMRRYILVQLVSQCYKIEGNKACNYVVYFLAQWRNARVYAALFYV